MSNETPVTIEPVVEHVLETRRLLDAALACETPMSYEVIETLLDSRQRFAEQCEELECHRLSYLHNTQDEKDLTWRGMVDLSCHLIDTIKYVRITFDYSIMTAKRLVETYRDRKYAFAGIEHPFR